MLDVNILSDIFLSYKREEKPFAEQLATALEQEGWSVWWDPDLHAGEHFDDAIEEALREAECVIVLWSEQSVESRYVRDEATYALSRDKLIPVEIEDADPPFRFERLHTARLHDWDGAEDSPAYQSLINDIKNKIGPPSRPLDEGSAETVEPPEDEIEAERGKTGPLELVRQTILLPVHLLKILTRPLYAAGNLTKSLYRTGSLSTVISSFKTTDWKDRGNISHLVVILLLGFFYLVAFGRACPRIDGAIFLSAIVGFPLSVYFLFKRRTYRYVWILAPLGSYVMGLPWECTYGEGIEFTLVVVFVAGVIDHFYFTRMS